VRDFLFGRLAFRLLHRRANRLIAVSVAIRDFYGGRLDPRFAVVYVGSSMHEEIGRTEDSAVGAERTRWGFTDDDIVVGFMGRLVEEKGAEDLVAAVQLVHAVDPRVKLLIVGSGRGQSGDVEGRLHQIVKERDLDFVVCAGFQSAEALYYRLFDQFVLSSRTADAYATSVVQAMMAGTPVIATATGGTAELVRDGVTGLLVPPHSPGCIADAILRLVREPVLARQLAQAAQTAVLQHNRESVTTALVERIYDEVLAEGRR
jgi:glycosyltransferase involved in cell wall biosynthesis